MTDGDVGWAGHAQIVVEPVNTSPVASAGPAHLEASQDTGPHLVTLSAEDVETPVGEFVFEVVSAPAHGLLHHDEQALEQAASITVTAVNNPPVASARGAVGSGWLWPDGPLLTGAGLRVLVIGWFLRGS